jgi:phosphohistidine phosphatase
VSGEPAKRRSTSPLRRESSLRLFFLRHGKAMARADWREDDGLRPLTPEGERLMHAEAPAIGRLTRGLELILTSPLARARRTAEIVAEDLGLEAVLRDEPQLGHGLDGEVLRGIVASVPDLTSLMVVGHEPDFSMTIGELIGGGRVDMKKGGLARVDVTGPRLDDGVLAWLLTPAQLTGE